MATLQELEDAFVKADEAGNTEDAQAFATEIKRLRAQPSEADYSNEGRSRPAPVEQKTLMGEVKKNPLVKALKAYGEGSLDFYKAIPSGLDKFGASLDKSIQGGLHSLGVPNMEQPIGEDADLQAMGAEAKARSPIMGTVGQVVGEELVPTVVGGGVGSGVNKLVKGKRAYDALSKGRKAGAAIAEGVAGGAAGGALAPQEGSRLTGAAEGALVGGAAGGIAGLAAKYGPQAIRWIKNFDPQSKAGKFLVDTFGKDQVDTWVQALRVGRNEALPSSSTAARLGQGAEELGTVEKYSRKYATEGTGGAAEGWRNIDTATAREGREALGAAVGDDLAEIQTQVAAKEAALKDVEAFLDKKKFGVKFKADITKDLPQVLKGKEFGYNSKAGDVVEEIIAKVNDPEVTSPGELARIWQQLGSDSRLSPGERRVLRQKLVQYTDHASGANLWSEGVTQWQEATDRLKQLGKTSKIYEDFVPNAQTGGKALTGKNLDKSINRHAGGLTPDGLEAYEGLDAVTRGRIDTVLDKIVANEAPKATGTGRLAKGNPWQTPEREVALNRDSLWGDVKAIGSKVYHGMVGDRNAMVQKAADEAMQNPQKFIEAFERAVKAGEITAKEAERARRILGITSAAVGSTGVSTAHPVRIELSGMAQ